MRDGHDLDYLLTRTMVYDQIRKSSQQVTARGVQIRTAAVGVVLNALDSRIKFLPESGGCDRASLGIPIVGSLCFVTGSRMEIDHHDG